MKRPTRCQISNVCFLPRRPLAIYELPLPILRQAKLGQAALPARLEVGLTVRKEPRDVLADRHVGNDTLDGIGPLVAILRVEVGSELKVLACRGREGAGQARARQGGVQGGRVVRSSLLPHLLGLCASCSVGRASR
jgi:hypothetical protein